MDALPTITTTTRVLVEHLTYLPCPMLVPFPWSSSSSLWNTWSWSDSGIPSNEIALNLGKELLPHGWESPVACPEEQLIAPCGGVGEVERGGVGVEGGWGGGRTLHTKGGVDGGREDTLWLYKQVKVINMRYTVETMYLILISENFPKDTCSLLERLQQVWVNSKVQQYTHEMLKYTYTHRAIAL